MALLRVFPFPMPHCLSDDSILDWLQHHAHYTCRTSFFIPFLRWLRQRHPVGDPRVAKLVWSNLVGASHAVIEASPIPTFKRPIFVYRLGVKQKNPQICRIVLLRVRQLVLYGHPLRMGVSPLCSHFKVIKTLVVGLFVHLCYRQCSRGIFDLFSSIHSP